LKNQSAQINYQIGDYVTIVDKVVGIGIYNYNPIIDIRPMTSLNQSFSLMIHTKDIVKKLSDGEAMLLKLENS